MARITIPLDALTSRINLGDRFSGLRSQSLASRFTNLKPLSEFFDIKRVSKPRDFADVQARVNYNLAYFSSNYAVVFVMLTIYSLLSNKWLLFDIVFVVLGMWAIGKMGGADLEIGTFRATTSQLYTGLACIAVPIAIFSGPIGTALWLTYRECFFRGGGLGGRPRTPYDVPRWGRPPGARLSRSSRDAWGNNRSWEYDPRFEEVEESEDDGFRGVQLDDAHTQRRYASDELYFDGVNTRPVRQRRSGNYYDQDSSFSEGEDDSVGQLALTRRMDVQSTMKDKEEELVEKALERISRARALGKSNVKLTSSEIDALERLERKTQQQEVARKAISGSSTAPRSRTSSSPLKGQSASNSPRLDKSGRHRVMSTASERAARAAAMTGYPPSSVTDAYGHPSSGAGYASGYYASHYPPSRTSSNTSLRQMQVPAYQQAHYSPQYYGPPDDYDTRVRSSSRSSRASRPDPSDLDWEARTRSNSNLVNYPLDQLPNHGQTHRAPRFDPSDPRYGSPQKRVVSGPSAVPHYLRSEHDTRYRPDDEIEISSYRSTSSEEASEDSGEGVRVTMADRKDVSHSKRTTRRPAAATRSASNTSQNESAKSTPTRRRR